ncbi:GNAT family N-acetyltransferase [Ruegeria arenilitoris]|uniref:GNAT family N-acetyltransferase n=1 Tax=Ruegeria arenilitoris TaxID=1173585 RepID=UPI00147BC667
MTVFLRSARSTDAGATGEILYDFSDEHDWMPKLHSGAETIAFCGSMIDRDWVTVAENDNRVVGFLARCGVEIHSLYIEQAFRGQGIGRYLLDHAKLEQTELSLFAFQANAGACRFYERNGFSEAARSDGAENDENLPDVKYVWHSGEAKDV